MRHINFIPADLRPKLVIPGVLIPVGFSLVLVLYVVGTISSNVLASRQIQAELAQTETENAELIRKMDALGGSKNRLKRDEAIEGIKRLSAKKSYWSGIFKEMSVLVPEGIWLTGFTDQKEGNKVSAQKTETGTLLIKGQSSSQEIIAQFLAKLEKSHHFAGVQIRFAEKEADIRPTRFKFEFLIPIKTITNEGGS